MNTAISYESLNGKRFRLANCALPGLRTIDHLLHRTSYHTKGSVHFMLLFDNLYRRIGQLRNFDIIK